jgi:transposase
VLFRSEERLAIIQLACTQPPVLKNWTLANLTEEVKETIGRSISIETVRKILKTADSNTASSLPPSKHKLFLKQTGKR